jgi:hypothetical protein
MNKQPKSFDVRKPLAAIAAVVARLKAEPNDDQQLALALALGRLCKGNHTLHHPKLGEIPGYYKPRLLGAKVTAEDCLRAFLYLFQSVLEHDKETMLGAIEAKREALADANKRRGAHQKVNYEKVRKVVEAETAGRSTVQTAGDLGIHPRTVSKYRKAAGTFGIPRPGRKRRPASS